MKKNRNYPINFNNDVYFKYLIGGDDSDCEDMRKLIIENVLGFEVEKKCLLNKKSFLNLF